MRRYISLKPRHGDVCVLETVAKRVQTGMEKSRGAGVKWIKKRVPQVPCDEGLGRVKEMKNK